MRGHEETLRYSLQPCKNAVGCAIIMLNKLWLAAFNAICAQTTVHNIGDLPVLQVHASAGVSFSCQTALSLATETLTVSYSVLQHDGWFTLHLYHSI